MMVDFRILSTNAWCFMKKPLKVLGTDGNSFEPVTGSKGAAPSLKVSPATWLNSRQVPGEKWKLGLSLSVFRSFKQALCECISMCIYIYNLSFPCMCWRWLLIFPMGKGIIFVENTYNNNLIIVMLGICWFSQYNNYFFEASIRKSKFPISEDESAQLLPRLEAMGTAVNGWRAEVPGGVRQTWCLNDLKWW